MCWNRKRGNSRLLRALVLALAVLAADPAAAFLPPPSQYGRVIIDNFTRKPGLAPVVFDHWLHRARFTCRLCHVDIGFAMEAKATRIKASTNREGFHCGACHNGKTTYLGEPVFPACSDGAVTDGDRPCERCHSFGKQVARKYDYEMFAKILPKTAYGVDWEEAEAKGLIRPIDFLEGVSFKREPLKSQEDFSISSRGTWMPDIVFSHKKHSVWNGCEVCHPEIFPATKKGATRYTMFQISGGQYCGVCHGKVAFPIRACEKCHIHPEGRR